MLKLILARNKLSFINKNIAKQLLRNKEMQKQQSHQQDKVSHQQQSGQQESPQVLNKVLAYLEEKKVQFQLLQHECASTSSEAAQIRNTPLQWGSKTMLVRGKNSEIVMLLYRANAKVSWNRVRKIDCIGKKSRMVTKEQLYEEFGLFPGAVPPFAHLLKIKGVMDSKFQNQQKMAFNAGLKSRSIVMMFKDFPAQTFEKLDITQSQQKKLE